MGFGMKGMNALFHTDFIGVSIKHRNMTREVYAAHGIKMGHTKILRTLERYGERIQVEISRDCGITPATTVSLLNVMERDGLIERHTVPQDRRAVSVVLTDKGREQLAVIEKLDALISEQLLVGFAPEEVATLKAYLERMTENIERATR